VEVTSLAFQGNYNGFPALISGHSDGVIKLWNVNDLKNVECVIFVSAHSQQAVRCLLVAGGILLSGGYDKSINVWYPQHQHLHFNYNL